MFGDDQLKALSPKALGHLSPKQLIEWYKTIPRGSIGKAQKMFQSGMTGGKTRTCVDYKPALDMVNKCTYSTPVTTAEAMEIDSIKDPTDRFVVYNVEDVNELLRRGPPQLPMLVVGDTRMKRLTFERFFICVHNSQFLRLPCKNIYASDSGH